MFKLTNFLDEKRNFFLLMNFLAKYRNILTVCLLLILVIIGFFVHLYLFSQTEYVNGTDGGFYAYKTREIVEEGIYDFSLIKSPASPPVIFLTSAVFAKFFGVFNGVKIATSLYSALLGVSVFILTRYITRSNKAALIAAFFVIFSALSLRIAADIRKNAALLFFIPLIIYILLKFFDNWWNIIPLGIVSILGILSHNSVITIWFIALSFLAFKFGTCGKLLLKEFLPIFVMNLIILILMIIFYSRISSNLSIITPDMGPAFMPSFENLNLYILPLMILSVPGIFLAARKNDRKNIFLLSWLTLNFLLTFSQVVTSKELWRFFLPMLVPVCIFVGYSFNWIFSKVKYFGVILLIVMGIIVVYQFFDFGSKDFQMRPLLDEEVLKSLETASNQIGNSQYVYTNFQFHSYFWARYYFGSNTKQFSESFGEEINNLVGSGSDVYLLEGLSDMPEVERTDLNSTVQNPDELRDDDLTGHETMTENDVFEVYQDRNVRVSKILSPIKTFPSDEQVVEQQENLKRSETEYDYSRFRYLSTYLILPYELVNIINPPYLPLWQIQLGFPLSLLIIGLIASIAHKIKFRLNDVARLLIIDVGILVVLIIFGFTPSFFWGARGHFDERISPQEELKMPDEMENGKFVPDQKMLDDEDPCGDGVCDQAEKENPSLCPQDCE